ncbi:tyrosine-type recombinase/integrase [Methylobacterium oryzisoli]|uniref:tyrosine-type recombinase/integrase n=1 Tax=Methylobacterium oryzisoli TaxID=3385502 RepID=UPI003891F8D6
MTGKLSATRVAREKEPGRYGDGGGLYLQVSETGAKSWTFIFRMGGRLRQMGLGSAAVFSLAEARERALACRKLCADGIDPIAHRKERRHNFLLAPQELKTFRECVDGYLKAHHSSWTNERHAKQWATTLEAYAVSVFGDAPVSTVDTDTVLRALEPIWGAKPETARRVRGRIAAVLDWATVRGYRSGANPAVWEGHLERLLPKINRATRRQHFKAMLFTKVPPFFRALREETSISAQALAFTILTAARTGETINATWAEFDLDAAVWTIPGIRMKNGRPHRVALSRPALDILRSRSEAREGDFVFQGLPRKGRKRTANPLSGSAMTALLRRLNAEGATVHGFRSSFRDWVSEATDFPSEWAEAAIAHTADRAYRRGDALERRREMMEAWAVYCLSAQTQSTGNAVAMPASTFA